MITHRDHVTPAGRSGKHAKRGLQFAFTAAFDDPFEVTSGPHGTSNQSGGAIASTARAFTQRLPFVLEQICSAAWPPSEMFRIVTECDANPARSSPRSSALMQIRRAISCIDRLQTGLTHHSYIRPWRSAAAEGVSGSSGSRNHTPLSD